MENLVGLTLEAAQKELEGKKHRTVRKDKTNYIITCDYVPERINLEIDNNIVTRVYGG